jgi:hypothetical protein
MSISSTKMTSRAIRGKALPSRRRFLKIGAAAASVPALAGGVRAFAPQGKLQGPAVQPTKQVLCCHWHLAEEVDVNGGKSHELP